MLGQLAQRVVPPTFTHRLEIRSDGNDDYVVVLPEFFRTDTINYGQLIKLRKSGRVVGKIRRIIYGNPERADIETTDVENFNGILRERVGRIVRRTKCYAKNRDQLSNAIGLFQFYWNFIHKLHKNLTPAIEEGVVTKVWTWGNLLHYKIKLN
jgi:hypothetical protein